MMNVWGRVKILRAPIGPTNCPLISHSFEYNINYDRNDYFLGGHTNVRDGHENLTRYFYNADDRLTAVEKFDKDRFECRERMYWGGNETKDCTNLMARTCENHHGVNQFARTYQYDEKGNVIEERLYGNLTGENQITPSINPDGSPPTQWL